MTPGYLLWVADLGIAPQVENFDEGHDTSVAGTL